MDFDAHAFDLATQLIAAHWVELFGHQYRREFDHVSFNAEAFQRPGSFQTQQATADHRTAFAAACAGFDGVEIFNGAVDETVLAV
ncbi:hypothetical protein D3C78_1255780 [compost metagenome]